MARLSVDEIRVLRRVLKDVCAERREYYFEPPAFLTRLLVELLKDPRDRPILFLFFNIIVLTLPGAALVFLAESHVIGFCFWLANVVFFQERFIVGLHYHSHRGLFKSDRLNAAVAGLLSPFFGMPSGLYCLHHIVMHHVENNRAGWDLSSTEEYQRDNLLHFLVYWARFVCLVWFELPLYAMRRGRFGFAIGSLLIVVCFWAIARVLCSLNPCAAFWLYLFPTFVNSLLLMWGNWCQHIFVDPANPRSNYHLAYNVINDSCNQRAFNDGYHIEHHANSRKHWSELPSSFLENIGRYAKEDAIVFEGIDPMKVGFLVFSGRYDLLAQHLVQFRKSPRSVVEVEAFLRSRLVPVGDTPRVHK